MGDFNSSLTRLWGPATLKEGILGLFLCVLGQHGWIQSEVSNYSRNVVKHGIV